MTRDGELHNYAGIKTSGTNERPFWELYCSCGWVCHSSRVLSEESGREMQEEHALNMATPIQVGEEVLVIVADVIATFERDGVPWLTLYNSFDPEHTIEVPEFWCDRAGPTPKPKTTIEL